MTSSAPSPAGVVFSPAAATTAVAPSPTPSPQLAASLSPTNHHSFPPSPPSSCGGQSPPPKSPVAAPSPAPLSLVIKPIPKIPLQKPLFSFSIENILRPEFGNNNPRLPPHQRPHPFFLPHTESGLRTPPKTPELHRSDSPVDLSHKPHPQSGGQTQNKSPTTPTTNKSTTKPSFEDKLTNTSFDSSCNAPNSRVRYPENPEELANPKVPEENMVWPAWVYCTRYSDRPSSGPRSRRIKRRERNPEEKRPRTAFTSEQLAKLKVEFENNKYLDDKRRQTLAKDLHLNESQIKIWFQNKRAKDKKNVGGNKNGLAQHLMAQGLYNHSTMPIDEDDPFLN